MEIRIFQIVIPLIALLFIGRQFLSFQKDNSTLFETLVLCIFWIGTAAVALFPDYISDTIAHLLGFKSNINALLFFSIGLLLYFQLHIYKVLKKQDAQITELVRKTALQNVENERIEA